MRTRDGAECEDQHAQDGPGRQGIAQQRESAISPDGKPRSHNARAHHCRQQEGRAQALAKWALRKRWHQLGSATCGAGSAIRPMSASAFWRINLSSERKGNDVKVAMRWCNIR